MGLNPATFLSRLQYVVTGSGFKRVIQGLDINSLCGADGTVLDATTTAPLRKVIDTSFVGIQVASSGTVLGSLPFKIPRDYDEGIDKLHIRFLCNSAGDTDTPTLDATLYRKRAGAAIATVDPTASAVINTNTALAEWVEIVSEGDGWHAGDAVAAVLVTGGTRGTSDAINIYAIEVVYASDLVYYEDAERSISDE